MVVVLTRDIVLVGMVDVLASVVVAIVVAGLVF